MSGFGPFGEGPRAQVHRRILFVLLAALFTFVGFKAVDRTVGGRSSRYDENVDFSRALVHERVNVYEVYPAQATHTKYPPFYFVYVAPFVPLSLGVGATLWFVLNLTLVIATLVMAVRLAWPTAAMRPPPFVLYALTGGVMGWITITNLTTSQVNIHIGFFVVLGLYLIRRGREGQGGFAIMVATMLKLTPALLLVWLAARRRWKAIRGATVGFLALWALVFVVLGVDFAADATRAWIDVLVPFAREGVLGEGISGVRGTNQSLAAALFRFLCDVPAASKLEGLQVNVLSLSFGTVNTLVRILTLLLVIATAWVLGRRTPPACSPRFPQEAALLMVLTLVISPITWSNHHIAMMLPYAVCLQAWRGAGPNARGVIGPLLAVSILLFLVGSPSRYLQAFALPLLGILLAGAVLVRLLRQRPPQAEEATPVT